MSEEIQYLTPDEMQQIREAGLQNEVRRLNQHVMNLDIALAQAKTEVMRHRLLIMKREHEDASDSYKAWFSKVKERLGVQDGDNFGFSPESGAVTITRPE